jgi:lysophospholipase L1-like esterase
MSEQWQWTDARELCVEGQGWTDTKGPFERLPARAEGRVRDPVWLLSRHCAGVSVDFETDAPAVRARWNLSDPVVGAVSTPVLAANGLDFYIRTPGAAWRWVGVTKEILGQQAEASLTPWGALVPGRKRCRVYLPLCNSMVTLEIGVPEGATVKALPRRTGKPIAYYGTSIVHGIGVSRPGMSHVAILGRRLDYPILNLGFSGNAVMEPEVADLLAELDPVLYVLDPVPNMQAALIEERAEAFVQRLAQARPGTPIVLIEDRGYPAGWITPSAADDNRSRRAAFKRAFARLTAAAIGPLHYIEGDALLGIDGDGTIDGSHPNDLGACRMADALEPVLRRWVGLPV